MLTWVRENKSMALNLKTRDTIVWIWSKETQRFIPRALHGEKQNNPHRIPWLIHLNERNKALLREVQADARLTWLFQRVRQNYRQHRNWKEDCYVELRRWETKLLEDSRNNPEFDAHLTFKQMSFELQNIRSLRRLYTLVGEISWRGDRKEGRDRTGAYFSAATPLWRRECEEEFHTALRKVLDDERTRWKLEYKEKLLKKIEDAKRSIERHEFVGKAVHEARQELLEEGGDIVEQMKYVELSTEQMPHMFGRPAFNPPPDVD